MSKLPHPSIGIDLGTAYSKIAWYNPKTRQAEVMKNAEGEERTPSVVYFGPQRTLVGSKAVEMLKDETECDFAITYIKQMLMTMPIIPLSTDRLVTPVEVIAELLRKLKTDVESLYIHREITHVVITHPVNFGPLERNKLRDAALLAGFVEIEWLEEPAAAVIACMMQGFKIGKCVLVYDLGASACNLTILEQENDGSFHSVLQFPKAERRGGNDFDDLLYGHCDRLAYETFGQSISQGNRRNKLFLSACCQQKEQLTQTGYAFLQNLLPPDNTPFQYEVSLATFESLIFDIIERTVNRTRGLLEQANSAGHTVDTIILIGGSTQIPLVSRLLSENIPATVQLCSESSKLEMIALGAAYHAYNPWKPENQYRRAVEAFKRAEKVDKASVHALAILANNLGLDEEHAAAIEREIMNMTKGECLIQRRAHERERDSQKRMWNNVKRNRNFK